MDAIEIVGLSKNFKGKRGACVKALENLNLSVGKGEIFGFLGPNGAGKSTAIKTVVGLIKANSGSARILGEDVTSHATRRKIGYLPENPSFYEYLSAEEYLTFVGNIFGLSGPLLKEKRESVLKILELWEARKRPIRGYSKGMVQRVGLAQVLIHDPDVYILDEPMSGLDPIGRALVKQILIDLKGRGKTVFFSTHVTADVEVVCDRVGVIVSGRLRALNSVEEIMETGIDGYRVQLTGADEKCFEAFDYKVNGDNRSEVYVPRDMFNPFMDQVKSCDASVYLIEPKRKNLEAFFLDIVNQEGR